MSMIIFGFPSVDEYTLEIGRCKHLFCWHVYKYIFVYRKLLNSRICSIGSLAQAALDWTAPGCRPMATRGQGKIPAAAGLMRCALGGVGRGGGMHACPGCRRMAARAKKWPQRSLAAFCAGLTCTWGEGGLGRRHQNYLFNGIYLKKIIFLFHVNLRWTLYKISIYRFYLKDLVLYQMFF